MHNAIERNNLSEVKELVRNGASIDTRDISGRKPIHSAAKFGRNNIIEFFLSKKVSIDDVDSDDSTPLHFAARYGQLDTVKFLVGKGANINFKDGISGKKPIHSAIIGGHKNIIEFFLSKKVSIENTDGRGLTPLHYAAQFDHLDLTKFLINKGANIHAKTVGDQKPIHLAARGGRENPNASADIIKYFLIKGVSVNDTDTNGLTPLHYAAEYDNLEAIKLLINEGANIHAKAVGGQKPIHLAACGGLKSPNIIELFLNKGISINEIDANGLTPLHYTASVIGYLKESTVRFLISRGANTQIKDNNGKTPLDLAREAGRMEIASMLSTTKVTDVSLQQHSRDISGRKPMHSADNFGRNNIMEFFLSKKVSIGGVNNNDSTPLHFAARYGQLDAVKFLVDKGANINFKDGIGGRKPIHSAIIGGHKNIVEFLLSKGVSVNEADETGTTTLQYAAYENKLDIAKFLIDKGANIYANCGRKPIHLAAYAGYVNIIDLFLSKGVSIENTDKDSLTPLHYAARFDHLDLTKFLINKGANIHAKTVDGQKPIHLAARGGRKSPNIIDLFLKKGISINEIDANGLTPLHYTAGVDGCFKESTVKFLISRGANTQIKDNNGKTPLDLARETGRMGIASMLSTTKVTDVSLRQHSRDISGGKPMHLAAKFGCNNIIEFFLSKKVSIDDVDSDDSTPLHFAARYGKLDTVKFLVDKGANINFQDGISGKKPIHSAIIGGHKNIVEFLLSKGVSVNEADETGTTTLQYAAYENKLDIAKFLIDKGANIYANNPCSHEPIHLAAHAGYVNIIDLFLSKGVSIESTDKDGLTPLHYAAQFDHLDLTKFLINKGANIHAKTVDGQKPIHLAAHGGRKSPNIIDLFLNKGISINEIDANGLTLLHYTAVFDGCSKESTVKFLISRGANTQIKDNNGKTPLDLARETGRMGIASMLSTTKVTDVSLQQHSGSSKFPSRGRLF